jgi:hypothetical protein
VTRLIRASEIGAFAFCERAWGYAARGDPSERQQEIEAGQTYHERRLRHVTWSQTFRRIGIACLILAATSLTLALTA